MTMSNGDGAGARRPKVVVVTWAVNHNPLGRAHVLAELLARDFDVAIFGYDFPTHGRGIWSPHVGSAIPISSHEGHPFPEQLEVMEAVGRGLQADAILVSKPRLPALATALVAKERDEGLPIILDTDDWELSFVHTAEPVSVEHAELIAADPTLDVPYGRIWTQVCETMIGHVDARTVSNHTLQERFGGVIVPHARDAAVLDPRRFDRAVVRQRLGVEPETRLVLFGGTPRRHKGILELAEAVASVRDHRAVLGLIDTPELLELRPELERLGCELLAVPPLPFSEMPQLLAAADVTAVLQDPAHPISGHQMPAKVTDALAMQVPCIVNAVPPLAPLIEGGHLEEVGAEGLAATLQAVLGDYPTFKARAERSRDFFVEQMSYDAVGPVLNDVVRSAIEQPREVAPPLRSLLALQRHLFRSEADQRRDGDRAPEAPVRLGRPAIDRPIPEGGPFDLIVFWKQNDSNLYRRRSDMLIDHLARSGRVAQVVHFDAPVGLEHLRRMGAADELDQSRLVYESTLRRVLGQEHGERFFRYTFLYDDRNGPDALPRADEYVDFVEEVFHLHGIGLRDLVFWTYPTNVELPQLIDRFQPTLVVSDVVDDNRTWYPPGTNQHACLTENYAEVLGRSEVVYANCEPVQQGMREFHDDVRLLPNACDPVLDIPEPGVPAELEVIDGPIIGYVGNLSSRIDIELLDHVAATQRDWNIVLVGSAHAGHEVMRLNRYPNVFLLGPKPAHEAERYIKAFDVAVIPHVDNDMTRAMNPLKAYVYCALGVPVVSTAVANMAPMDEIIKVARGKEEFVASVEEALREGRRPLTERQRGLLLQNSWEVRAERALEAIDEAMGVRARPSEPATAGAGGGAR